VKILLDMNLSPAWVPYLTQAGFDCVHWRDVGEVAAPDTVVMSWARDNGYVLFTHDMDYGALLAASRATGPSVLQVRVKNTMPDAIGHDVVRVLNLRGDLFRRGVLVTVDRVRARIRVLPLGGSGDSTDEPG
jgi:predicted nuclease of predicted toxin-antitoxin system